MVGDEHLVGEGDHGPGLDADRRTFRLEGDGLGAPYDETTRKLRMRILPKGRQADSV